MLSLCRKHRIFLSRMALLATLGTGEAFAVEEHAEVILQSDWPTYVNGANIASLPQINRILSRFDEHEKIGISIRYPGGEAGQQWAKSLQSWLISFGVPGIYIEILPASGAADRIILTLIDRR